MATSVVRDVLEDAAQAAPVHELITECPAQRHARWVAVALDTIATRHSMHNGSVVDTACVWLLRPDAWPPRAADHRARHLLQHTMRSIAQRFLLLRSSSADIVVLAVRTQEAGTL